MKKLLLILLLVLNKGFAQWEYQVSEKEINAIGEIQFNTHITDTITLNLSKSRKLGLDFAIEGNHFNTSEKYYVLFEISGRKIKVLSSILEKGKLRILELKDLIYREEYDLEEFLKILKNGSECILTIRSSSQVIQGSNKLNGSKSAINNVLRGNYP